MDDRQEICIQRAGYICLNGKHTKASNCVYAVVAELAAASYDTKLAEHCRRWQQQYCQQTHTNKLTLNTLEDALIRLLEDCSTNFVRF